MPTRTDVVEERIRDLGQDLNGLLAALTRDPKRQTWNERFWRALSKAAVVVATMAARRMARKAWRVLTGEPPPSPQR